MIEQLAQAQKDQFTPGQVAVTVLVFGSLTVAFLVVSWWKNRKK